jgi:hypothetical protein
MDYLAPQPWHDFFSNITLKDVRSWLNAEITW